MGGFIVAAWLLLGLLIDQTIGMGRIIDMTWDFVRDQQVMATNNNTWWTVNVALPNGLTYNYGRDGFFTQFQNCQLNTQGQMVCSCLGIVAIDEPMAAKNQGEARCYGNQTEVNQTYVEAQALLQQCIPLWTGGGGLLSANEMCTMTPQTNGKV